METVNIKRKLQNLKINLDFKKILNKLDGQSLHAKTLGFTHPSKNKYLEFNSDLPKNFKNTLKILEKITD